MTEGRKQPPPGEDCEPVERLRRQVPYLDVATLREHIREGVTESAKQLARDSDFARPFWQSAVDHAAPHAFDKIARWIGNKLIMAVVGGAVLALAVYAVRQGWIK